MNIFLILFPKPTHSAITYYNGICPRIVFNKMQIFLDFVVFEMILLS